MIKSITPMGRYITVTNSTSSTYINGYSGSQGVGNMRYNTSSQNMEVFDGNNWVMLNMSIPSIGLNGEAESLLDWARQKRHEELELQALAQEHTSINDLVNDIEKKKDQIKMIRTLIKSPGNAPTEMMGS
jgi:CRISPR/Cas system CSM-associated protein Csm4 (group 5 of RAMP superfamily)